MNYLKRQEGVVQLLVVGLVVAVLIVVGLAAWQFQKAKTADQTASSPTPTLVASSSPSPASSATPTSANEFKVTELGFKMTLPAGLPDLKYTAQINQTGKSNGTSYQYSAASFSTQALEQIDAKGCSAAQSPLGAIIRYSVDPNTIGTTVTISKKVGNFYLGFETPQAPCTSTGSASQLLPTQASLLRQAFDSATAL